MPIFSKLKASICKNLCVYISASVGYNGTATSKWENRYGYKNFEPSASKENRIQLLVNINGLIDHLLIFSHQNSCFSKECKTRKHIVNVR